MSNEAKYMMPPGPFTADQIRSGDPYELSNGHAILTDDPRSLSAPGPFTADQIRSGDPYELSNGHAIFTPPTGQRGGKGNLVGGKVLATDPAVKSAGIDVGFSRKPNELRAPDISVGNVEDAPGWATVAPPLAVEYADVGQDETELKKKIVELFDAGTRYIWVVRLATRERHVEVHEPGKLRQIRRAGEELTAPGVLQNPVPVEAMWDGEVADGATLRNLLNRQGYSSVDEIFGQGREEGRQEGREEGRDLALLEAASVARSTLLRIVSARGLVLGEAGRARIEAEASLATLAEWTAMAATASEGAAFLEE